MDLDHSYTTITFCDNRKRDYLESICLKYKKDKQDQIWSGLRTYFENVSPMQFQLEFVGDLDRLFPENKKNGYGFWVVKDTHFSSEAIVIDSLENMDSIMTKYFETMPSRPKYYVGSLTDPNGKLEPFY